jgi:hypothetical protein
VVMSKTDLVELAPNLKDPCSPSKKFQSGKGCSSGMPAAP